MPLADRTRLAARVPADYPGFGYAPLLPDDLKAMANIAGDLGAAPLTLAADGALIAADVVATRAERVASSTSASAAAGMVTATADRAAGRRLNDVDLWSVIRATPSWNFGPDGALVQVPADTLAWDFDPATAAPLGLAFAGARTNRNTNPRGSYAALPSFPTTTPPDGWGSFNVSGLSREIVGYQTISGVQCVFCRFIGTPTVTGAWIWSIGGPGESVAVGTVVTNQAFIALVGGSLANASGFQLRTEAAGASDFTPTATLQRIVARQVTTEASALTSLRWFNTDTVTPVDFTLAIGLPQREYAPFSSDPILPPIGSPGVSTRAQGNIDIPVWRLGNRYNRRQGVLIVEWNSQPGPFTSAADADAFGLFSLGDLGANEVMGLVVNPAHSLVEMRRVVGGVAQSVASCAMTPPAAGQRILCAMAWDLDAGLMQVAARGAVGTQLTGQTSIPIITHAMPGRFSTTRPLFGRITGAEIRPAAAFGSTLAAMT